MKKSVLPKGALVRKKSWAATESQFRGKHRVSESAPKARIYLADRRPLFSSFTDDKQYHYAPTAAVLEKIEEEYQEQGEANAAGRKKRMSRGNIPRVLKPQRKA